MNLLDKIKELRELSDKATLGRCEKVLRDDGAWSVRFPDIPRGFNGHCYSYSTFADGNDVDFDIASRTAIPELCDALEKAIAAIKFYGDGFEIMDHIDGTYEIRGTHYEKARTLLTEWGIFE